MSLFSALPCDTMLCTGVWTDPYIILTEPGDCLYDWIEKFGNLLAGFKTLFLTDDITADETLDKQRQPLLGLAISGLTQRSFAIVANAILYCYSHEH